MDCQIEVETSPTRFGAFGRGEGHMRFDKNQLANLESVPRVKWRQDPEYQKLVDRAIKIHRIHGLVGLTLISFTPPFFGISLTGLVFQTCFLYPDPKVKWVKDRHTSPSALTEATVRIFSGDTFLGMDAGYMEVTSEGLRFLGTQASFTVLTLAPTRRADKFEWCYVVADTPFRAEFSLSQKLPSFVSKPYFSISLDELPPTAIQTELVVSQRLLRYTTGFITVALLLVISQTLRYSMVHNELNEAIRVGTFALLCLILLGTAIALWCHRRTSLKQREYSERTFLGN